MKHIIIAGASGYVGKTILEVIKDYKNFRIIALCINRSEFDEFNLGDNIEVMTNEEFFLNNEIYEDAYLINLAFPRKDDINIILDALEYMRKLYSKALESGVNHIINTSSQSVYNIKREIPAKETDLLEPFSLYGLAKIYTENYTENFAKKNNINYINIRLASIVGPGFDQRIINKLIKKYVNNENISLEERQEKFSYLHVLDAVKGFIEILKSDTLIWNRNLNLGTSEKYTISDIMQNIEENINHNYIGQINIKNKGILLRTNEVDTSIVDKETNWKVEMSLKEIVKDIYNNI